MTVPSLRQSTINSAGAAHNQDPSIKVAAVGLSEHLLVVVKLPYKFTTGSASRCEGNRKSLMHSIS